MNPYEAAFGIDAFDFDEDTGRRMALDKKTQKKDELARRLTDLYWELRVRGVAT